MDEFSLQGRTALVTGASKGIGKSLALALARAGATVVVAGRAHNDLERVRKEVSEVGAPARAVRLDVRSPESIVAVRDELLREHGRLDILVNNAGVNAVKPALEVTEDDWDSVLDTNTKGYFLVAQAFAPAMLDHGYGKIINVSSVLARVARPNQAPYAASKGGVEQLTKVLALEWASRGVRVNALAPGYTLVERLRTLYEGTPMYESVIEQTPLGRWSVPEDLAGAIVFLASPASDFVTGQTLFVDGGLTIR